MNCMHYTEVQLDKVQPQRTFKTTAGRSSSRAAASMVVSTSGRSIMLEVTADGPVRVLRIR